MLRLHDSKDRRSIELDQILLLVRDHAREQRELRERTSLCETASQKRVDFLSVIR
jgi:hypothetical protein